MPATELQEQYQALLAIGQPAAAVNDPYVPTSLLNTKLALKADRADVLGFAQDTLTALNQKLDLVSYTVANLPTPGIVGRIAFASNGRALNGAGVLEAAGSGTGVEVQDNGSSWRIIGTNQTVQA